MSILDDARDLSPTLEELRREFHRRPELAFEEHWTASRIEQELRALGLEPQTGVAGTGLVVRIEGSGPGPALGLRADMDGLPVEERTALDFQSENEGRMHACGHDAHLSMLLGAARILVGRREQLPRDVTLLFQPSEEKLPGGAPAMIREGALEGVGEIYGLHVISVLPTGLIALRPGPLMASPSDLEIRVRGVGGHAALPQHSVDPVVLASQVVVSLQTLVSRRTNPLESVVVTIGAIHGGTIHNVIPEEVRLLGTVRTLSDRTREELAGQIEDLARGIVEPAGGQVEVVFRSGYPVLENSAEAAAWFRDLAIDELGADQVSYPCEPLMAGEDFSYYLREVPGAFAFLGCGGPVSQAADQPMNHHPQFQVDESCLPVGAALLARAALSGRPGETPDGPAR